MKIERKHIIKGVALSFVWSVLSIGLTFLLIALVYGDVVIQGELLYGLVVAIPAVYTSIAAPIDWILNLFYNYVSVEYSLRMVMVQAQIIVTPVLWAVVFTALFSYIDKFKKDRK